MECKDFEPSIIQENRILRLCKRLDKFTFEEVLEITEDIEEQDLKNIFDNLISENKLIHMNGIYFYNKQLVKTKQINMYPLFFQFHNKTEIEYILKGFCANIEVLKIKDFLGISKNVVDKFYNYFRTQIYEKQKQELLKYYDKIPRIGLERKFMSAKIYLYLYNGNLFVSDKNLCTKNEAIKHSETERLKVKNIYLRSFRKVQNRTFTYKFHLHLAEEVWRYGKDFKKLYVDLTNIINI